MDEHEPFETTYLDPYDITQEGVIELSKTMHTLYGMVSDVAPDDFPRTACPCLDCLWHVFRDQFAEGRVMRLGRSQVFPDEPYAPREAYDTAEVKEIEPGLPNWLDLDTLEGLNDLGSASEDVR